MKTYIQRTLAEPVYFSLLNSDDLEENLKELEQNKDLMHILKEEFCLSDVTQYIFNDKSYITNDNGFLIYGVNHSDILHGGE